MNDQPAAKESKRKVDLDNINEEDLLGLRICDLPLKIKGEWLEECIGELYKELEEKDLKFRPDCYLADEWLTPVGEPVIGIPFFLAHPTLMKLEKKMMMEVEGGTKEWCMKLLRLEAGHELSYAFNFHKKKRWQNVFGPASEEYPANNRLRPYSKNYVRHLDDYYAQYHPEEDFVETFAVWLTPNLDWKAKYKGWPALKKLKEVDKLMQGIKGKAAFSKRGKKFWRLSRLRITLKNYYHKKRQLWAEDFPDFHDPYLRKIFKTVDTEQLQAFIEKAKKSDEAFTAVDLVKKYRRYLLVNISKWTGERKYVSNDLLKDIEKRCRDLNLIIPSSEFQSLVELTSYMTSLVMNYKYTGRYGGEKRKK